MVSKTGEYGRPMLLKYEFSQAFALKYEQTQSLSGFEGRITRTYLSGIPGSIQRNSANLSKGGTKNENQGECPPEGVNVSGGGSNGTGSGSDSGGCEWVVTDEIYSWKVCDNNGCDYYSDVISTTVSFECDNPVNTSSDSGNCSTTPGKVPINDQKITKLCSDIEFKNIGYGGQTAGVINLGFTAHNYGTGQHLLVYFPSVCITVPSSSEYNASVALDRAYDYATTQMYGDLSKGRYGRRPTAPVMREAFKKSMVR